MAGDWQSVSHLDLPYKNLVISGFLGVGKSTVGRRIARVLELDLLDVDEEIELQELMSIAKIRELYGDSRLKALEHEQCRTAQRLHAHQVQAGRHEQAVHVLGEFQHLHT